jgi:hypothetical protein
MDTTERGVRGWKEAQRQGEDRVTLLTLPTSLMFLEGEGLIKLSVLEHLQQSHWKLLIVTKYNSPF